MYELALFAGGGGGILAGEILGWTCIGAVEKEEYQRAVLLQRQNDGALPPFPVWDDVATFREDNPECRQYIRHLQRIAPELVISGGFPCQDISVAGKGAGLAGERSGLWWEYYRIICEVRPAVVFLENSPMLTNRGLADILAALAEVGYHAAWGVLGASDVGANHHRKRIWLVAYTTEAERQGRTSTAPRIRKRFTDGGADGSDADRIHGHDGRHGAGAVQRQKPAGLPGNIPDSYCQRREAERISQSQPGEPRDTGPFLRTAAQRPCWWSIEPPVGRVVDGLAGRVGQLETLGNGQVPRVAAAAFTLLSELTN